jgi:hypothetical protein
MLPLDTSAYLLRQVELLCPTVPRVSGVELLSDQPVEHQPTLATCLQVAARGIARQKRRMR